MRNRRVLLASILLLAVASAVVHPIAWCAEMAAVAQAVAQINQAGKRGEDADMSLLVSALSDRREIKETDVNDQTRETWSSLKSRKNVPVTVHDLTLHFLIKRPQKAVAALLKQIREVDQRSKADHNSPWTFKGDDDKVFLYLQALAETHSQELLTNGVIAETQVLVRFEDKTEAAVLGATVSKERMAEVIAGYLDHRNKLFAEFRSPDGKIHVTRRNVVPLATAIAESVEKGPANKK